MPRLVLLNGGGRPAWHHVSRALSVEEIGRAYEFHVGQCYERQGFSVSYRGITRGTADMGIDLIAQKANRNVLVQCKCWSADAEIQHIEIVRFVQACDAHRARHAAEQQPWLPHDQLRVFSYGMAFITSAKFSRLARAEAARVDVRLRERFDLPPDPDDTSDVHFAREEVSLPE